VDVTKKLLHHVLELEILMPLFAKMKNLYAHPLKIACLPFVGNPTLNWDSSVLIVLLVIG
jgi:hypothetical protein